MESIPRKPLRTACHCSLALLGLTCLLSTADARPSVAIGANSRSLAGGYARGQGLPHAEQSRCLQSGRGRESSSNPGEYFLYCTSDEKLWTAGAYNPRRAPFAARAGCSWISHCRMDITNSQAVLPREEQRLTSRRDFRKASPNSAGCSWARVAEFAARAAPPLLDAALRLAAQQHHELRSLAGLRAHPLVRDNQGGSRRNACDAIQCVLRNHDAVERGLGAVRVRQRRLNVAAGTPARAILCLNRATRRKPTAQ